MLIRSPAVIFHHFLTILKWCFQNSLQRAAARGKLNFYHCPSRAIQNGKMTKNPCFKMGFQNYWKETLINFEKFND